MIFRIFIAFLLWEAAFGYPQAIRIPEIKYSAAPQEVNSLTEHKQYPRSIGKSPTTYNKIEETIKEVEAMLKINPTLPRLTRGEIMDLIENITKEDMVNGKFGNESNDTNGRDPKAIMVVMPYTPSTTNDKNMEDLFTKPPVTHIVGAEPFQLKLNEDLSNLNKNDLGFIAKSGIQKSAAPKEESLNDISYHSQNIKTTSTQISIISTTTSAPVNTKPRTKQRRRRPPQPTYEQQRTTQPPITTHRPRRPLRRRPSTTEKHPNHRYPDEAFTEPKKISSLPSEGIKIIEGPKFDPVVEDLIMQENRHKDVFTKEKDAESLLKTSESASQPSVVNTLDKKATDKPLTELDPQSFKDSTTLDNKSEVPENNKPVPTNKKTPAEDDELRQMLASLGMMPISTTTTTTAVPDISNVADNLTPEMRDLLRSFGLISNADKQPTTQKPPAMAALEGFNPVKAEVNPDSYTGFKPLPEDDNSRQDMEELLARFGLGGARKRKSLPKKEPSTNFDAVPEQYKGVLEDIGLMDRDGRMIRAEPLVKTEEKQHVFNPGDSQYASDDEVAKLNRLLDFVKKLEKLNRTVTDEDVQKMDVDNLKELLESLNKEKRVPLDEQNAPNPINFDHDHSMDKNEVKRQKNSTVSSNPKEEVENITLSINAGKNKEDDVTPNIKDLEASFGGQVDANPVTEPPVVETTPTPRTGFYYLMDWNTFLDIDDQKGKRVNLRFQPKSGDPKRFLSVSVP